jgi:hypothetical protein
MACAQPAIDGARRRALLAGSGCSQVAHGATRRFDRAVEAEALRLLVAQVELVQIVSVDHRCRCPAVVRDSLDVFSTEHAQRDVPAAERVGRCLRQVRQFGVARRSDARARLDVSDEVVLLLERVVAVGRSVRDDEVVVADR